MTSAIELDPLRRRAILLALIDSLNKSGSWTGQTHLQKSTFLFQEMFDVDLDIPYVLYKHGPYSFQFRDELILERAQRLVGFVSREPYGPSIQLTENGHRYIDRFSKTVESVRPFIDYVAGRLSKCGVAELERITTAFFVTRHLNSAGTVEERAQKLCELKPHISQNDAISSINTADEIFAGRPTVA